MQVLNQNREDFRATRSGLARGCLRISQWAIIESLARGIQIGGVLAAILLAAAPAALAQSPFEDAALVDQYKETVPTASGPKVSGGGSSGGGTPLSPAVVTELRQAVGEKDAKRLEEVATSPRYGAPLHAPDEGGLAAEDDTPGAVSAAVTALAGEGGGSLLPLLLALVFATGTLSGAAVYRRRRPIV